MFQNFRYFVRARVFNRRTLRRIAMPRCAEILEPRLYLDTTLSSAISVGPLGTPTATFTATQKHGPATAPLIGNQWWYGQTGDRSDGSFAFFGQGVQSKVKIWGGGAGGQCNTINGSDDAGEVLLSISGLPAGDTYVAVTVMVNWSSIGPATTYNWRGQPLATVEAAPIGADTSGTYSQARNNGPLPAGSTPATMIMNSGTDTATWYLKVAGGGGNLFRWTPSLAHTGNANISYTRTTEFTGIITLIVMVPPMPIPGTTPGPSLPGPTGPLPLPPTAPLPLPPTAPLLLPPTDAILAIESTSTESSATSETDSTTFFSDPSTQFATPTAQPSDVAPLETLPSTESSVADLLVGLAPVTSDVFLAVFFTDVLII